MLDSGQENVAPPPTLPALDLHILSYDVIPHQGKAASATISVEVWMHGQLLLDRGQAQRPP